MAKRFALSVARNGPRVAVENAVARWEESRFDAAYGTDTDAFVALDDLAIASPNKLLGVQYEPTLVRPLRKTLERLRLPAGRVLVDFGSGKGRVMMAASAYGFRRIVGVEFSPELCAICRRNLDVFRRRTGRAVEFEVVESDAADYRVRADEDVFFFYNPFQAPVMTKVLANIHASVAARPRRVWMILHNPAPLEAVFASDPGLREIARHRYGSSRFFVYAGRNPA